MNSIFIGDKPWNQNTVSHTGNISQLCLTHLNLFFSITFHFTHQTSPFQPPIISQTHPLLTVTNLHQIPTHTSRSFLDPSITEWLHLHLAMDSSMLQKSLLFSSFSSPCYLPNLVKTIINLNLFNLNLSVSSFC